MVRRAVGQVVAVGAWVLVVGAAVGCGGSVAPYSGSVRVSLPGGERRMVQYVRPREAYDLVRANRDVFLLYCGDKDTYNRAHIPGTVVISAGYLRGNLESNRMYPRVNQGRVPRKGQPILLYAGGKRCCPSSPSYTKLARRVLLEKGFQDVRVLSGGMEAWKDAQLPYESTRGAGRRIADGPPAGSQAPRGDVISRKPRDGS